ncbi:prevent-host-death family protein [Agrobacterium sp. a22-2]|uniref:type II toxin-antitoxin system Phd/YefM family antitoxin n=1 Tax=Agrobacterium sp. a22-2 TaxID=2283840 RepID=UPI0014477A8A|nr:prevent-host-death family protein [Agrobacterium sp. a22-2]NKN38998.1 prevent-host-death family protein [Agrobacterium sp. a22-2]
MKIFAEPVEAAERLEELISLAQRDDEVIICREGVPIAVLTAVREDSDLSSDRLLGLMAEGRPAADRQTSNHDEFYDENGPPK